MRASSPGTFPTARYATAPESGPGRHEGTRPNAPSGAPGQMCNLWSGKGATVRITRNQQAFLPSADDWLTRDGAAHLVFLLSLSRCLADHTKAKNISFFVSILFLFPFFFSPPLSCLTLACSSSCSGLAAGLQLLQGSCGLCSTCMSHCEPSCWLRASRVALSKSLDVLALGFLPLPAASPCLWELSSL